MTSMTPTVPAAASTPAPQPAAPSTPAGPVGQWLSVARNRYLAAAATVIVLAALVLLVMWGGRRKQQFALRALDEARNTAEVGNLPLAASQLQRVITTYAGTDAAAEATMALNQVRLVNGQSELAAAGLREFIKTNPAPKYLGPSEAMLGVALENTRKPAEAAEAYLAASRAAELSFLKAEYLLDAGRALVNAGKKDEAIKAYRQIVTDMKDSPSYTEAMVRLAELTGGKL